MEKEVSYVIVAGICGLVLLISVLKHRAQFLLNFVVRMVLGAIAINFINDLLVQQEISVAVGINPTTLLTVGTLGFSGVALLYAIVITKFL